MDDIVPGLYKQIKNYFDGLVSSDEEIQAVLSGKNKEITFSDVSLLSRRLGEYATDSIKQYYRTEFLPDGRLHWNILERTVVPLMQAVYELVNQMAATVQKTQDAKYKIGIKPQRAPFPRERITEVMNKAMSVYTDGDTDG